jgi:ComF family protein
MADEFNARIVVPEGVRERYCYAAALFFYNSVSGYRNIPRQLKYNFRIAQGRVFARRLGDMLASAEHFRDVDAVVPVPLHWTRRWKRGYNQAEVIASEVADALGAPLCPGFLSKPRRKASQVKADARQRASNISGAFKANVPEGVRHILIIDDTFTTGSTLAACYAAFRECLPGQVRISVATLAFVKNN